MGKWRSPVSCLGEACSRPAPAAPAAPAPRRKLDPDQWAMYAVVTCLTLIIVAVAVNVASAVPSS